jgi:hypothetical protein
MENFSVENLTIREKNDTFTLIELPYYCGVVPFLPVEKMKKLLLVCLTYAACAATYAQTFVNHGAPVAVTQGGLMIVKTDGVTTGSGSLENDAAYQSSCYRRLRKIEEQRSWKVA